MKHIYPIFDQLLGKNEKERLLKQRGKVIWLIGLSGSGKSTLAKALERRLYTAGFASQLLDGDNLRHGLNADLGFTDQDRAENLRRTAQVARLFKESGIVTICSFITPTENTRQTVRDIIGAEDYLEVYVDCPLDMCEQRDVKGLYKKARAGEIKDFTGISAPFEPPLSPDISIQTALLPLDDSAEQLFQFVLQKITYTNS
ncbi:MAG: adenylyl-sulfate kinase [Bacteroidetes bacterium]|nr:adenylyl-sulfate kinase [Bacteroidota bacterium]